MSEQTSLSVYIEKIKYFSLPYNTERIPNDQSMFNFVHTIVYETKMLVNG